MYSIEHVELFVARQSSFVVGNARGVCEWKAFSSIGLDGLSLES